MTAKRYHNQVCGKIVYSSKKQADDAMVRVKSRKNGQMPGKPVTYYCETCKGWHFGNATQNWDKAMRNAHKRMKKRLAERELEG